MLTAFRFFSSFWLVVENFLFYDHNQTDGNEPAFSPSNRTRGHPKNENLSVWEVRMVGDSNDVPPRRMGIKVYL